MMDCVDRAGCVHRIIRFFTYALPMTNDDGSSNIAPDLPVRASNATPPVRMGLLPIDDIRRLLDNIENVISELRMRTTDGDVDVMDLPELGAVLSELVGPGMPYTETTLGIHPVVLNQFVEMRGTMSLGLARNVAEQVRTFLHSQDQIYGETGGPRAPTREAKKVTILGGGWVAVRDSSDLKRKIGAVASLLDTIIAQAKHPNVSPEDQILTEIERQQLIAILETALNVLKSTLVEKALWKKAQIILRKGAESAAEQGVQKGLGRLMESAVERLAEVIKLLF